MLDTPGGGSVWLEYWFWKPEIVGSNPTRPTMDITSCCDKPQIMSAGFSSYCVDHGLAWFEEKLRDTLTEEDLEAIAKVRKAIK